jgi:hypothetical protein
MHRRDRERRDHRAHAVAGGDHADGEAAPIREASLKFGPFREKGCSLFDLPISCIRFRNGVTLVG